MERHYLDEDLRRLVAEPAFSPAGWSHAEVQQYRRLVDGVWAAETATDLWHLRMLRLERDADDPTRATVNMSSGRTIGLIFKSDAGPVAFELLPPETDTM